VGELREKFLEAQTQMVAEVVAQMGVMLGMDHFCQMAPTLPLAPTMYLAIRQQDKCFIPKEVSVLFP
jgi:hypothetical protein